MYRFNVYGVHDIMLVMFFAFIYGGIIFTIISRFRERKKNNKSPQLSVNAVVVNKTIKLNNRTHYNGGDITGRHGTYTTEKPVYYIKFQVESGDCLEFSVSEAQYSVLSEGDMGIVTFKGSTYLGFNNM